MPVKGSGGVTWNQRKVPEPAASRFALLGLARAPERTRFKPWAYAETAGRLPAPKCPSMALGDGLRKNTPMRPWILAPTIAGS